MEEPCIVFEGSKTTGGYGMKKLNGTLVRTHRQAWVDAHGPIPNGLFVLHKCDNRACMNVNHLFLGTHKDNARDRAAKGRSNRPTGEKNPKAKLTEKDVVAIRADPRVHAVIAAEYGVTQVTVSAIKRRETWKNVP